MMRNINYDLVRNFAFLNPQILYFQGTKVVDARLGVIHGESMPVHIERMFFFKKYGTKMKNLILIKENLNNKIG